jgi:nitrate/nitrite-specific signal transduction histidine kinase
LLGIRTEPAEKEIETKVERPLRLLIKDDGHGFDLANLAHHHRGGHFGYIIMRERIESLGGQFEVFSRPGQGTQLLISLPLAFSLLEQEAELEDDLLLPLKPGSQN